MKKKFDRVKDHVVHYAPLYYVGAIGTVMIGLAWKYGDVIVEEPKVLYEQVTPFGIIQVIAPD